MKLFGACIQTHNIEEMVAFYSKIFGYQPAVDGGVDFRFPDHQLIIYRLTDTAMPETKAAALIYSVDDVDAVYSRLAVLNMTDKPPTDKPWGVRSFVITDPDGNTVSFMKAF